MTDVSTIIAMNEVCFGVEAAVALGLAVSQHPTVQYLCMDWEPKA